MAGKRGSSTAIEIVSNDDHRSLADNFQALADGPRAIDDLPATIPVTERELDIIETYLGQLINDVLKG